MGLSQVTGLGRAEPAPNRREGAQKQALRPVVVSLSTTTSCCTLRKITQDPEEQIFKWRDFQRLWEVMGELSLAVGGGLSGAGGAGVGCRRCQSPRTRYHLPADVWDLGGTLAT